MIRSRPTAPGRTRVRTRTALCTVAALLVLCALPLRALPPGAGGPHGQTAEAHHFPLGPIADFLDLTADQVDQTKALLDELRTTVRPLREQETTLHRQLGDLLEGADPDAAQVGALVIQIRGVRDQVKAARDGFDTAFTALLTPAQAERWEILKEVRRAFGPRHRRPGGGGAMAMGS